MSGSYVNVLRTDIDDYIIPFIWRPFRSEMSQGNIYLLREGLENTIISVIRSQGK